MYSRDYTVRYLAAQQWNKFICYRAANSNLLRPIFLQLSLMYLTTMISTHSFRHVISCVKMPHEIHIGTMCYLCEKRFCKKSNEKIPA